MRGFRFVTTLLVFGFCCFSMSCSKKELTFSNVEDNAKVRFSSGTKSGVAVNSSGNLTIDTDSIGGVSLDPSWTPKYNNIVGYWKMDGDWTDSSGNGNDGTPVGSATFDTNSKVGTHSGSFSGGSDGLGVGTSPFYENSATQFSLLFWAYVDPVDFDGSFDYLLDSSGGIPGANNGFFLVLDDRGGGNPTNGIFFSLKTTSGTPSLRCSDVINIEGWYHIGATYDANETVLYLNGVEACRTSSASGNFIPRNETLGIGIRSSLNNEPYTGLLDEVAIWTEALSGAEIQAIYQKQSKNFTELRSDWTPQWGYIVGYWKMDGNWLDSSGSGNHGSVLLGSPGFTVSSKIGSQAMQVYDNGASEVVGVPDNDLLDISDNLSFSMWMYYTDTTDANINLVAKAGSTSDAQFVTYYYGDTGVPVEERTFRIFANAGGSWSAVSERAQGIDPGRWYHAAFTYNSTEGGQLYIDGVKIGNRFGSGLLATNGSSLRFGETFNGNRASDSRIDDFALWNTELTHGEVSEIYHRQKQKYAGSFTSHVFDFGTPGSWLGLDVITPLPFMKELPGQNGNESSSVYSSLVGSTGAAGDDDLMDGLVGLWHMEGNTNDVSSSGIATIDTSVNFQNKGRFGQSLDLSGSGSYVSLGDNFNFPSGAEFTHSIWFKVHSFQDYRGLFAWSGNDGQRQDYTCLVHSNKSVWCEMWLNGTPNSIGNGGQITVEAGDWNHLVFLSDGTDASVYFNGEHVQTKTTTLMKPLSDIFYLGTRDNGWDLDGELDEYAVWSRALGPAEILQLYRRGANRLKYQVRSCAQPDCSDSEWKGPGGDGTTYYSELFNRLSSNFNFSCSLNTTDSDSSVCVDDEISFLGSPLVIAPSLLFRDMAGSATLDRNRYFQFKVLMESDDENNLCSGLPCLPELKSLKVRHGP